MTETADGKKTGAAARAEAADDNAIVSRDTFDNPALATLANTPTVKDGYGIERIVGSPTSDFVPAPMTATDEQKAQAEKFETVLKEKSEERQKLLTGSPEDVASLSEVDDKDRVANNPGVAGQTEGQTLGEKEETAKSTTSAGTTTGSTNTTTTTTKAS